MSIKQKFKYQAIDTHLANYIISSNCYYELTVFLHRFEILNLHNQKNPSIFDTGTKNLRKLPTATACALHSYVPSLLHINKHQKEINHINNFIIC